MKTLDPRIGYVELSLAQLCLSVNIILGKMLAPIYPIVGLLALRFLIGFSILAFYLAFNLTEIYSEIKKMKKTEWVILSLKALCGGFLFNILTLHGLQYTTATATGIVNSTIPAFVALFSFLILKEVLTKRKMLSIGLTVFGILLLSIGDIAAPAENELYGLCFVSLAVIPASLFIIFSKMINASLKPLSAVMLMNLINTFLFLPLAFQEEWIIFSAASILEWLKILIYGISGSLLFFVFWYRGVARTTASTAALFIGITPISTSLFAYFFLPEPLSIFDLFGMLCVIVSIFIGALQPSFWQTQRA
jgi:drug/metabolite transporter (DMT)-like permease